MELPRLLDLNFSLNVSAEREAITEQIMRLMSKNTPASVQEACRLHCAWLQRFPDDYAMFDLGGSFWMLADAIEAMEKGSVVRSNAL